MAERHGSSPMNVLVVEDSDDLRHLFARMLRRRGYVVREAADGMAALESLANFLPDLVLTDLMMPILDGFELIRRMRASPATASIPVLAITADATPDADHRARAAGAADVLIKPVEFHTLLGRLSRLCG